MDHIRVISLALPADIFAAISRKSQDVMGRSEESHSKTELHFGFLQLCSHLLRQIMPAIYR